MPCGGYLIYFRKSNLKYLKNKLFGRKLMRIGPRYLEILN